MKHHSPAPPPPPAPVQANFFQAGIGGTQSRNTFADMKVLFQQVTQRCRFEVPDPIVGSITSMYSRLQQ